ncbi:MAG: hypothetical protein AAFP19_19640 [Bacteroidota bacterium]
MNKAIWSLIGFSLFIIGFLALVLMIVGVQLSYLTWIDSGGRLMGFVIRLLMILSGVVIVVLTRTNWREENEQEESPYL